VDTFTAGRYSPHIYYSFACAHSSVELGEGHRQPGALAMQHCLTNSASSGRLQTCMLDMNA
jgi:hypothetical protein